MIAEYLAFHMELGHSIYYPHPPMDDLIPTGRFFS